MTIYLYGLIDPETRVVFYIGKTSNPERRYTQHLEDAEESPKVRHIRALKSRGKIPELVVLQQVGDEQADRAENDLINEYLDGNAPLTNRAYTRKHHPQRKLERAFSFLLAEACSMHPEEMGAYLGDMPAESRVAFYREALDACIGTLHAGIGYHQLEELIRRGIAKRL